MKRYLGIVAVAALSGMFAAGAVQSLFSAYAVQNELVPPTSGIYTGIQYSQKIGDAFKSLAGCNKGATAPANVEGSTVDGLCWIDDSGSPWVIKQYVNGGWAVVAALDPTDSSYAGVIGGGLGTIASGTTTDLNSAPQANVTITGTTTITGFGSAAQTGITKILRFAGALKLTNSSGLTVPGGYDLTTAANDRAIVTHLGSGNWEITQYTRANGIPVDVSRVGKPSFDFSVSISPLEVAGYGQALLRTSYPAYFAKTTRAQNGTRTSGNATITSVADTSGFGAGMPVESTGVNAGCTIASVVANTSITLNSSGCVTSSGTSTVTVFPYGYGTGGDSTKVGVPDCRTVTLAGRDRSDPGSLRNLLTTSYFGSNAAIYGVKNGSENHTLLTTEMPSHTHTGTTGNQSASHTHNTTVVGVLNTGAVQVGGGGSFFGPSNQNYTSGTESGNHQHSFTSDSTGSGLAHAIVMPTLIAECAVRVTP